MVFLWYFHIFGLQIDPSASLRTCSECPKMSQACPGRSSANTPHVTSRRATPAGSRFRIWVTVGRPHGLGRRICRSEFYVWLHLRRGDWLVIMGMVRICYRCVCMSVYMPCVYIYIYIYIYMVVDQNSFIAERPFFANKNFTFAKLSRTPCLSFAGPMLANNTSYEDSFTTCQITPENHGSLLGSLLNMQLASRNPFSGQIFFAKFTGPPSTCTLTFARSFA